MTTEDTDAATRALAVREGAAAPVEMKLSNSLRSAARDEFVYVGRNGEVRPVWRYKMGRAVALGTASTLGLAGIGLCFAVGMPWLSLLYVGALGLVGNAWRHGERLKAAAAMVAAEQLDTAEVELRALVRARTASKMIRALAWHNLGGIEMRRSHPNLALEHVQQARALLETTRKHTAGPWRWINRFSEGVLLAQLGRVTEARKALEDLQAAPEGEYFEILRINVRLMLAFATDDVAVLPPDLHAWTRLALDTTSAELALTLLGWAHVRRGDDDMAALLIEQALDRMDEELFRRLYPKPYAWVSAHRPAA
jgi:tetratricopeptide (TPR) repeat protein